MNRAIARESWFTLTKDWTVAACGDGVGAAIALAVGHNLWDMFPGSEEDFRATYEEAWANGRASRVIYSDGVVTDVHAFVRGGELLVAFAHVTVQGIRETVDHLLAHQEEGTVQVPPPQASVRRLHAVPA